MIKNYDNRTRKDEPFMRDQAVTFLLSVKYYEINKKTKIAKYLKLAILDFIQEAQTKYFNEIEHGNSKREKIIYFLMFVALKLNIVSKAHFMIPREILIIKKELFELFRNFIKECQQEYINFQINWALTNIQRMESILFNNINTHYINYRPISTVYIEETANNIIQLASNLVNKKRPFFRKNITHFFLQKIADHAKFGSSYKKLIFTKFINFIEKMINN